MSVCLCVLLAAEQEQCLDRVGTEGDGNRGGPGVGGMELRGGGGSWSVISTRLRLAGRFELTNTRAEALSAKVKEQE